MTQNNPPNTPPYTQYNNISFSVAEDIPVNIGMWAGYDFSDSDGHSFKGILVESVTGVGTFSINGVPVLSGDFISAADASKLTYTSPENFNGYTNAAFSFRYVDDGGTENGGNDTATTITTYYVYYVSEINDAPTGADNSVTINEDEPYVFAASVFGFADIDGHALKEVIIEDVPETGRLMLNGVAVKPGQIISASDIAAGKLIWTPDQNAHGDALASLKFKLVDNGSIYWSYDKNTSLASYRLTFNVESVNDAPTVSASASWTYENAATSIDVLSGAKDVDGDALSIVSAAIVSGFGSVTISDDGKLVYDPTTDGNQNITLGESLAVVIRFTISDGKGGEATADVTVAVRGVETDIFKGTSGDDHLIGSIHDDILQGYDGNDLLDGGFGADWMFGGKGDDTYIVDDADDNVAEKANEGIDLVKASISYKLTSNVENLALVGVDEIDGTGNDLANILTGNGANNTLDGGAGADNMIGGAGNDTYIVDNSKDTVIENASEGADLVKASVSYTLSANVENLTLTSSGKINGTGNGLANVLTGNNANNILDGKAGADRMIGGKGDDTYIVDNAKDVVTEKAKEGTDLVKASVSHTLAANVENLILTGAGKISGTGNSLANIITGNSANNTLDGKAGADTLNGGAGNDRLIGGSGGEKDKLYGGSGADTFVFTSVQGATAVKAGDLDTIFDFSRKQGDRIDLKAIDANTKTNADDAFTFIKTDKFHKKAGELRYEIKNGDTFIFGDTNGDGTADFSIRLDLALAMKGGDFIL